MDGFVIYLPRIPVRKKLFKSFWLGLLFGLLIQQGAFSQTGASIQAEFSTALETLPQGRELESLPPDTRAQVLSTRKLYQEGASTSQMSNTEIVQLSLKLKANTARSQQLIALLSHTDCLQDCLRKRTTCKNNCPSPGGLVCKCCLRCNLQLDICASRCLLRQYQPAARPAPPGPGKKERSRR